MNYVFPWVLTLLQFWVDTFKCQIWKEDPGFCEIILKLFFLVVNIKHRSF